ncbi:MAG: FHA domain-containing protein [Methylacidiphilales bacterium]|nr:FHA domain-containing protein [Candidatus Methylacidiphilales bacterium]
MESYMGLFSVEEAFVRVGRLRQKGCLRIFNVEEEVHLFVDNGNVIHAAAERNTGESALERALELERATFEWLPGAESPKRDMQVNIQTYTTRNSVEGDEKAGKMGTVTVAIPVPVKQAKPPFGYFFVPEGAPHVKLLLKKETNVVGRDPSCDLHLVSVQVSRQHCVLEVTDRGLLVKDLDSKNGTSVNGIALKEGYVDAGDKLSFGSYVLRVCRE